MQIRMALATGDQENWRKSDEAFQAAHQRLAELQAHTAAPVRLRMAKDLESAVVAYEATTVRDPQPS